MNDRQIIELFQQRDERAIQETQSKYGAYCFAIAGNILSVPEDAEECVNDAWNSAWNRIPPVIPVPLKAFLGKLTQDLSLSRYRANHAEKRYSGMDIMLEEAEQWKKRFRVRRWLAAACLCLLVLKNKPY